MGAASSSTPAPAGQRSRGSSIVGSISKSKAAGRSTEEVVSMMMPVYFTDEPISEEDVELAKLKWGMILDDTCEHFLKNKGQPGYDTPTCIMLFYDSFYQRLFDIHPMSRPMFKSGLKSQGKFLVKMVSLALSLINKDDEFIETMRKLAEVHNERGVKAVEYGIVGEVMFWSLRKCLGPEYDSKTHKVWTKVFCRMLKVMVPIAVAYELRNGDAQIERLKLENDDGLGQAQAKVSGRPSSARVDGSENVADEKAP